MSIENTNKAPWNEFHGLTEGDMLEELAEFDHHVHGVPLDEARAALDFYSNESLRKSWWYAIGRHNQ